MARDLEQFPLRTRGELAHIVRVIREGFAAKIQGGTQAYRREGRILKILLYGSRARGDFVEDRASGYVSDYDILVVVNHERLADATDWFSDVEERLLEDYANAGLLTAPVSLIIHSLADVNDQLKRGRYFFRDIIRDGLLLFETEGHPFAQPTELPLSLVIAESQAYAEEWISSAVAFLESSQFMSTGARPKEAAFMLHQACERLYHSVLLTLTLYSPKSHKLNYLRPQAEALAPELAGAWPRESREDRRRFDLLRRAYVEARYSPHYRITQEELDWIAERVRALADGVRAVCEQRLGSLRRAAEES